ncbi:fumarate lyase [Rhizodiscina lignyota]|uniref:Arginosuccinase n=1 Tax=Rhizodiscina lignyota TaxID=1504668 RepID=A0A9P4M0B4_9PEZI|nr:fumarate lyase [Rhizodiscina lignyota]
MEFGHQLNRASLIAVKEAGLIDAETAQRIASSLAKIEAEFAGRYTSIVLFVRDYPALENRLVELAGSNASLLHLGRSRQDMISACVHAAARDTLRHTLTSIVRLREAVLKVAENNVETLIPAYTHGVQAQPTTYAHYLLAMDECFSRTAERLIQSHKRLNQCPLGAGALTTSSFKLDRELLASLLGFEGIVENSLSANQVSPVEALLETSQLLAMLATQIGQWAQDIHQTYSNSRSWFRLDPGELTSTSSMMPQKRNPRVLELMREFGGRIIGKASGLMAIAHNLQSGMTEIRWSVDLIPDAETQQMLDLATKMVASLRVDAKRALEEINREYSTATELADTLYRTARVPFRIGHHFASKLTDFGRERGLSPTEINIEDAAKLYAELNDQASFPLSESEFRESLHPQAFVASRAGTGGPQRDEVVRMLSKHQKDLEQNASMLGAIDKDAEAAVSALSQRFERIIKS